jgi:hypothetical protein
MPLVEALRASTGPGESLEFLLMVEKLLDLVKTF